MSSGGAAQRVRATLVGASGRMGQALLRCAPEYPRLRLTGAVVPPGSPALGRDAGALIDAAPLGVSVSADLQALLPSTDVVIDFSRPEATAATLAACRAAATPLLIGTTGFPCALETEFAAAAGEIALLVAPNTSLGVTLLLELARRAAAALPHFRARITETHHRHKRDAPSGTALALAAALRSGAGSPGAQREIPIESHREGEVIGEHTVWLEGAGEALELSHRALDRAVFARGAIAAALWLAPQPPGRYGMADVLNEKTVT